MNKKIVLWTSMILLLATTAIAEPICTSPNDAIQYWDFDEGSGNIYDYGWDTANHSTSLSGDAAFDSVNVLFGDFSIATKNGNLNLGTWNINSSDGSSLAIGAWIKPNSTAFSNNGVIFDKNEVIRLRLQSGGEVKCEYRRNVWAQSTQSTTKLTAGTWAMVACWMNSTHTAVIVNNTLEGITADSEGMVLSSAFINNIGSSSDLGVDYVGYIEEVWAYDYDINQTVIDARYNSGAGGAACAGPAPPAPFEITVQDNVTQESLLIFSAIITNSTGTSKAFSTTNGTINTNISNGAGLLNITLNAAPQNYTQLSLTQINSSAALLANMTHYWYSNTILVSPVNELQTQTITLVVNVTTDIDDVDVTLDYPNATITTLTKDDLGTHFLFNATLNTPAVSTSRNITMQWNISLDIISGQIILQDRINTTTAKQEIVVIEIDNCTTFTTIAINMTVRNLTDNSPRNATLAGFFSAFLQNPEVTKDFNLTWDAGTNFGICINGENQEYNLTGQIEYSAVGSSVVRTHFFNNNTINNNTQLLDLFVSDDTTQVIFEVVDQNDNALENVFINMLRFDLATNTFKTVEIMQTGSDGKATGNAVLNTAQYKFVLFKNNVLIFESSPIILTTSTQKFTVNFQPNFLDLVVTSQGTVCRVTFDNSTKLYNFFWSDPSGAVNNGKLEVRRKNPRGDIFIGTNSLASSSGDITVNITSDLGNNSFIYTGQGIITISGSDFTCGNILEVDFDQRFKTFGLEGVLVTMLLVTGMAAIGIWHPIAAIVLTTTTLSFAVIFGVFKLSYGIMMAFIVLAGIALFRVSQK